MNEVVAVVAVFVVGADLAAAVAGIVGEWRRRDAEIQAMLNPPQHQWTGWELLIEPGISDVDHGQYQRAHIRCAHCGEERDVWKGIDRTAPTLLNGCQP